VIVGVVAVGVDSKGGVEVGRKKVGSYGGLEGWLAQIGVKYDKNLLDVVVACRRSGSQAHGLKVTGSITFTEFYLNSGPSRPCRSALVQHMADQSW
jgi:hypothetical protein